MKILVTLDSFKGSLNSYTAGAAVAGALSDARPHDEIQTMGIADGGEGSLEVFCVEGRATRSTYSVMGPLEEMVVSGGHAWRAQDSTALVEMALASGLGLLGSTPPKPLEATTYGTGQCLLRALNHQPERIVLAVGGSATTDGGVGAARAMGWRFLDASGRELAHGGGALGQLSEIIPPETPFLFPPLDILCDVNNPLVGADGAAAIYGPQKGASTEDVAILETGLQRLAQVVADQMDLDINVPGAGAAGGLAGGAMAFLGGCLKPGVETLMSLAGMDNALDQTDYLITGEGSLDHQSLRGKVISGLLGKCHARNIPVGVIAGQIHLTQEELQAAGIAWALPLMKGEISLEQAMAQTEELLRLRAREAACFLGASQP